MMSIFLAFYP